MVDLETLSRANVRRNNELRGGEDIEEMIYEWLEDLSIRLADVERLCKTPVETRQHGLPDIAEHCAEMVLKIDLVARAWGIGLDGAVRERFNAVSEQVGSEYRV